MASPSRRNIWWLLVISVGIVMLAALLMAA